jgi:hypothetical protein
MPRNKAKSSYDELILAIRPIFRKVHVHVGATGESFKAPRAEAVTPYVSGALENDSATRNHRRACSAMTDTLVVGSSMGESIQHRETE